MSLFRKLPLVVLLLSLLVVACNETDDNKLEVTCDVDGAFECLEETAGHVVHRLCVDSKWANTVCDASQSCRESGCVAKAEVCSETATRCLDAQFVEHCTASEAATIQACGDGFVCNSTSCASGGDCCVATEVCSATATRCLDAQFVEHCTASKAAKIQSCGDGFVCNAAACAGGGDCCVATEVCSATATRCLDAQFVEHCTASKAAKIQSCGDGFVCNSASCASGGDCCVATEVCSATATRCFSSKLVEHCTVNKFAEIQSCGDGFVCDSAACGSGGDCCVEDNICKETANTCLDDDLLEICVKGQSPSVQACDKKDTCEAGECTDFCDNGRLDAGEEAVDCGGACEACVRCKTSTDCGTDGFCDSGFGYVCSKRCRSDADCANSGLWDGNYCRGDGRCSPKVFETVWELTDEDPTVELPFGAFYSGNVCDFQILWGDEPEGTDITTLPHVTDCQMVENRSHTYSKGGRYHVKLIGTYDAWAMFDEINISATYQFTSAAPKLRGVLSFGPVGLKVRAFYGASELVTMPERDMPDASKLGDLDATFYKAISFNAPIGHWDTSNVTRMGHMFYSASVFNQPLAQWDTSQVTSMFSMFDSAEKFNQPIGDWNTSKVRAMLKMFYYALAFDQPIGDWDTSSVTDMDWMFSTAKKFNQPIGEWNISHVDRMNDMFAYVPVFNQDLSKWNLKSGVELTGIFKSSGMSNDNLCALRWKGGEWLGVSLVKNTVCAGD